ncbi:hypothetical protein [Fimbriiglobus ruber]|uniref:Uncharacterized protein n=1 Tax=Fimbriiglobus ruber TaxID=1908690 RepID=A0A225DEM3_9BACT|nr:hypothetical protein [Fimbriiglobus ruber]OWK35599.1 hypothetical protein FRUB_08162 [Fimbriiglobus ruber]
MSILAKILTSGCLASAALAVTVLGTSPELVAQPGGKEDPKDKGKGKDKGKFGPKDGPGGKHKDDLKKTYDILTEVSAMTRPAGKKKGEGPAEAESRRYLESAKRLYRDAVQASDAVGPGFRERAAAAQDAARGVKHWVTAALPLDPDLPLPPDGPFPGEAWEPARTELQRAKDRIGEAITPGGPGGREFMEAASRAYAAARSAYEAKDFPRAAELARAAEAWTHVSEHLARVSDEIPPPTPRDGPGRLNSPPPPPGGRGAPPPPPVD